MVRAISKIINKNVCVCIYVLNVDQITEGNGWITF